MAWRTRLTATRCPCRHLLVCTPRTHHHASSPTHRDSLQQAGPRAPDMAWRTRLTATRCPCRHLLVCTPRTHHHASSPTHLASLQQAVPRAPDMACRTRLTATRCPCHLPVYTLPSGPAPTIRPARRVRGVRCGALGLCEILGHAQTIVFSDIALCNIRSLRAAAAPGAPPDLHSFWWRVVREPGSGA